MSHNQNQHHSGTSPEEYSLQWRSNNYIKAVESGRLTAGQAAKILSKRFGCKITARMIEPLANEYHHAGRFGRNKARRVFFFSLNELEEITLEDIRRASAPVWGWVLGFRVERVPRGKKRYIPIIADVGLFPADKAMRLGDRFHRLSEEEAAEAKAYVGKALPPFCDDWRQAR